MIYSSIRYVTQYFSAFKPEDEREFLIPNQYLLKQLLNKF